MSVAKIDNVGGDSGVKLEDISSLSMTLPDSRYLIQMPMQGYSQIRFRNYTTNQPVKVSFCSLDGTEISSITIQNSTSWTEYYDIPTNTVTIILRNQSSANAGFYIGLIA